MPIIIIIFLNRRSWPIFFTCRY